MAEDKKQLGSYHRRIRAQQPENHDASFVNVLMNENFRNFSLFLRINKIVRKKLYARPRDTLKGIILNLR